MELKWLTKQKKNRRKIAMPEEWRKNKSKKMRMLGEKYQGYTRKDGRVSQTVPRAERKMNNGCVESSFCKKSMKRNCDKFPEAVRKEIFQTFWKMDWSQKKVYVLSLVTYQPKKRCYVQGPSRRQGTFCYHLRFNNSNYQVCKKMFLKTLGLNEKMVQNWIHNGQKHGLTERKDLENKRKSDRRSRSNYFQNTAEQIGYLKSFFDLLPKVDSHYCRKDSQKLYLEHPFHTKNEVYEVYKKNAKMMEKYFCQLRRSIESSTIKI